MKHIFSVLVFLAWELKTFGLLSAFNYKKVFKKFLTDSMQPQSSEELHKKIYKDFPLMSSLKYHVYWDTLPCSKYKSYNGYINRLLPRDSTFIFRHFKNIYVTFTFTTVLKKKKNLITKFRPILSERNYWSSSCIIHVNNG